MTKSQFPQQISIVKVKAMDDYYITKAQALSAMRKATNCTWDDIWNTEYVLKSVPAVDVAPVVHAEWRYVGSSWECSNCLFPVYSKSKFYRYCPQCGARMDGKEE